MTYKLFLITGDTNGEEKAKSLNGLSRHDVKLATETFKTVLETQFQVAVSPTYGRNDVGEVTEFHANIGDNTELLGRIVVQKEEEMNG